MSALLTSPSSPSPSTHSPSSPVPREPRKPPTRLCFPPRSVQVRGAGAEICFRGDRQDQGGDRHQVWLPGREGLRRQVHAVVSESGAGTPATFGACRAGALLSQQVGCTGLKCTRAWQRGQHGLGNASPAPERLSPTPWLFLGSSTEPFPSLLSVQGHPAHRGDGEHLQEAAGLQPAQGEERQQQICKGGGGPSVSRLPAHYWGTELWFILPVLWVPSQPSAHEASEIGSGEGDTHPVPVCTPGSTLGTEQELGRERHLTGWLSSPAGHVGNL